MTKNRPGQAKQALRQQEAATRRGASGRRFVGDAAGQRDRAVRAERKKVRRMAEVDRAQRTAELVGIPVVAMLADVAQNVARLGGLLVRAPYLIARAFLGPREA